MKNANYEDMLNFLGGKTDEIDSIPGMTLLNYNVKLFRTLLSANSEISAKEGSSGKRYCNRMKRVLWKIVIKGIKVLRKKIPIYVELPKFEKVLAGQVKKVINSNENVSHDDEIEVNLPSTTVYRTPPSKEEE